jgi:hypothetical protein
MYLKVKYCEMNKESKLNNAIGSNNHLKLPNRGQNMEK